MFVKFKCRIPASECRIQWTLSQQVERNCKNTVISQTGHSCGRDSNPAEMAARHKVPTLRESRTLRKPTGQRFICVKCELKQVGEGRMGGRRKQGMKRPGRKLKPLGLRRK